MMLQCSSSCNDTTVVEALHEQYVLMAVLSFPVVISILLMAVRLTKNTLDGENLSDKFNRAKLKVPAINPNCTALVKLAIKLWF